jgi:hypothetical protein
MKYITSFIFCLLFLFFANSYSRAQSYPDTYASNTITLRSDFPSKSVLMSNLQSDKAGDMSPIIGAASWDDNGKQLQCRSLLEFNYLFIPRMIMNDPSLITSAELVLYPVQVTNNPDEVNKKSRFIVRRVLSDWEDTATRWLNQPDADSAMQVKEELKKKQKSKLVSVDVTGLVMDMIRNGNNGFMICQDLHADDNIALSQWFASPKNEDENKRPLLVIRYKYYIDPSMTSLPSLRENDIQRQLEMKMSNRPATGTAPVAEPVKTDPVKD